MPKFVVSGKFSPSNLEGLVTKRGGQSLKASTMWDANRVISDDDWTVRALEQLFAADAALDDQMIDRFGTRVLSYDQAALLANPLAYYPLNEASGLPVNLGSASVTPALLGSQTQGVNAGYLAAEPGRTNYIMAVAPPSTNGIQFDASGSAALAFTGAASHSLSCWIRQSTLDTTRYIVARFDSGAGVVAGWRLATGSTGQLTYTRASANVQSSSSSNAGTISANTLYHVGVAYDGALNRSRLFINGLLAKTTVHTTIPTLPAVTAQTRTGATTGGVWNGEIGGVAIYDVALPDWHFRAQWAAGVYGPA